MYVNKNLGEFTDTISARIRNGYFSGINPGNYFTFNNVAYSYKDGNNVTLNDTYSGIMRVMDLDYLIRRGSQHRIASEASYYVSLPHHVAIVPDNNLFIAVMNDTNTTEGGYVGSKMRTTYLKRARAIFEACFGANHVLAYNENLINKVTNEEPSGYTKIGCRVELMDERMIFNSYQKDSIDRNSSTDKNLFWHAMFAAFLLTSSLRSNKLKYWERNIASSSAFCRVDYNSTFSTTSSISCGAKSAFGVRPVAFIY